MFYKEGLLVGYRWFDAKNIEPLFPFGFGLSYTHFEYSGLQLVKGNQPGDPVVTAEFGITNKGKQAGAEVAQFYVRQERPSLPRPVKELKGFKKVFLKPGETGKVSIPLTQDAFAFYDPRKKAWVAENDAFTILVGSSARDIRLQDSFNLVQQALKR